MPDHCFFSVDPPVQLSYFTSLISILLAITTTTGNFLIILAVIRDPQRNLRTPFAYFLTNLTLSDFVVGILAMPVSVVFHYQEAKRQMDPNFPYILHLTYFVSASASLFSMAAMCIDRYHAFISLTTNHRRLTSLRCIVISIFTWLLAGAFSSFYFLTGYVTLLMIYVHVSLITCFGITLLTYLKIVKRMQSISVYLAPETDGSRVQNKIARKKNKNILREKKVTKAFVTILVTAVCTYAPSVIFIYILQFCLSCSCESRHVLRDLAYLLVSASSATNPIVCIVRLSSIRRAIRGSFSCRRLNDMHGFSSDSNEFTLANRMKQNKSSPEGNISSITSAL